MHYANNSTKSPASAQSEDDKDRSSFENGLRGMRPEKHGPSSSPSKDLGFASRPEPVDGLRPQFAKWSQFNTAHYSSDEDQGSEYELLLEPSLPEETRGGPQGLGSDCSPLFDEEDAVKEEEDSPYQEVRAAVRNYDEDLPCDTFRAWTIGLFLVLIGASMNTIFSLRAPSIGLGVLIAQVIAWPMGHTWAKVMPSRQFSTFGIVWDLNPGPFNIKEHSIIVVMASVSFSVAYATDIILAQLIFYKQNFGVVFQIMLVISTQSIGYGIAGIMRKFLGT